MPLLLFMWYIVCMMEQKEKFPYEIEDGAIMDFVDGKFMFVLKDHAWSEEEIKMLKKVRIALFYERSSDFRFRGWRHRLERFLLQHPRVR